jgi:8-oxo-dGTP pyrophosphatase MutT (NUDIX family)
MSARMMRIAEAVRAYQAAHAEREEPYWEAAVAMILRELPGRPIEVLFMKRAERDGDPWSGQVSFPGGRRDKGEADLAATVVRETHEETGLDLLTEGELIGPLDELRPRTPMLPPVIVRPYVARLDEDAIMTPSDEVATLFWVPLDVLLDPANTRKTRVQARGKFWMWHDAIHHDGHVIWGMTERIIRAFKGIVG